MDSSQSTPVAQPDPLEAARQLLKEDEKRKIQAYLQDIEAVNKKHGFQLQPVANLTVVTVPAQPAVGS